MPWPDFLVIGAARSGTTSLYHYLRQHPQIVLSPVSEPNYFALDAETLRDHFRGPRDRAILASNSVCDPAAYQALFAAAAAWQVTGTTVVAGEASPLYLYSPVAAARIRSKLPGVRLVVMLRDPVQRAFSNYVNYVQTGIETLPTFAEALAAEPRRIAERWGPYPFWQYRQLGYYHTQLRRYYDAFPASQIRVYLHEDFVKAPEAVMRDLYDFLEVEATFPTDVRHTHNRSGLPRSRLLHRLLTRPNLVRHVLKRALPTSWREQIRGKLTRGNLRRPRLEPETQAALRAEYREETLRLQELLQRDLTGWL